MLRFNRTDSSGLPGALCFSLLNTISRCLEQLCNIGPREPKTLEHDGRQNWWSWPFFKGSLVTEGVTCGWKVTKNDELSGGMGPSERQEARTEFERKRWVQEGSSQNVSHINQNPRIWIYADIVTIKTLQIKSLNLNFSWIKRTQMNVREIISGCSWSRVALLEELIESLECRSSSGRAFFLNPLFSGKVGKCAVFQMNYFCLQSTSHDLQKTPQYPVTGSSTHFQLS